MNCRVLVVGAGGPGVSFSTGGGGGGGGVLYTSSHTLSLGSYNVVVGSSGQNSSFDGILAYAGGTGGSGNGASGGGGNQGSAGGTGIVGQGYNGGSAVGQSSGAGGGGAGGVGGNSSGSTPGVGGIGLSYDISGTLITYGAGSSGSYLVGTGKSGTPNTGNGGQSAGTTPGSGGSGIVIIRYATADATDFVITGGTVTTDGADTIRTFTTSSTLLVASLINHKITSIEAWGAGGSSQDVASDRGAGGGGGGAYAKKNDLYISPNEDISFPVVVGGVGTASSFSGSIVYADYGRNSQFGGEYLGGSGGLASNSIGDVVYSGGNGGNSNSNISDNSGGGGGSAGPDGAGIAGTNATPSGFGPGGNGNNNLGGLGGTTASQAGENNVLGGGGGAGGNDNQSGSNGGFPGGGAGGGNSGGGSGASGILKLKYVTTTFPTCTGGIKTTDGIYTIHTFTTSDTFYIPKSTPTVTTQAVTSVDILSAVANGNLTGDGEFTVTEKGFVYAVTENPTTSDNKVIVSGSTLGAYTGDITGLTANTTYYVRSYATNTNGTSYGEQVSFTTLALSTKQLIKDINGIEGETYAISINVGGTAGSITLKLGTTGDSVVINAGAGVTTFTGTYSGLSGVIIEASDGFDGYIDDFMYVLVLGDAVINWALSSLTNVFPINSSVTFRRVEDKEITRFNLYRYLDVLFKDLDGYVTVTLVEEKNDLSYSKSKQFLVGNTGTTVSPFVKKRISMLSKNQAILIGFSNNKLNETFTVCQYSLTGFKEPRKLYKLSKIISI